MLVFATLVRVELKRFIRYPWALLLSVVLDPIVLLLTILVFSTIYQHNGGRSIAGYSLNQIIWYFAATQLLWHCVANHADRRLAERINSGELTQDLLRPTSVITSELGVAVALRLAGVVLEVVPSFVIFILLVPPDFMSPGSLLRFAVSAVVAFLILFFLNFLVGLAGFPLQDARFLLAAKQTAIALLAGALIPLEFFPPAVRHVLGWLPFSYIFYWPIQFVLNRDTVPDWSSFLAREGVAVGWLAVLFVVAWTLWRRMIRRYTDAGG